MATESTDSHARLRRAAAGLGLIASALGGVIVWAGADKVDGEWHAPVFNIVVMLAATLAAAPLAGPKRVPAAVGVAALGYYLGPLWLSYAWEPNHTDDNELTGEAGATWDIWGAWEQTGAQALAAGYAFLVMGLTLLAGSFVQPKRPTDVRMLAALALALVMGIAGLWEMSWKDDYDDYGDDTFSINLVYANHVMPFVVRIGGQFFVGLALFGAAMMHRDSAIWLGLSTFINGFTMGHCVAYSTYQEGERIYFFYKLGYCDDRDQLCQYYQHQVNAYSLLATGAGICCFAPLAALLLGREGWQRNKAPSRRHLAVAGLAFFLFMLAAFGVNAMGNNATSQPRLKMLGGNGIGMFACAFFAGGLLLQGPLSMLLRVLGLGMAYSTAQNAASFMAFPALFDSHDDDGPNWAPTLMLIASLTLVAAMPCDPTEAWRHLRANHLGCGSVLLLLLAWFFILPFLGDAWAAASYRTCEDAFAFLNYALVSCLFVVGGCRERASRGFRALALLILVNTGMLAGGFFDYWVNVSRSADGVDGDERTMLVGFLFATVGCGLGVAAVVKAGGDWASDENENALEQTLTGDAAL